MRTLSGAPSVHVRILGMWHLAGAATRFVEITVVDCRQS